MQALANAGVSAAEVDVVEAHGTGTRLGDPIEAQALLATYGSGRGGRAGDGEGDGPRSLWLGSVKSNIGHTQAAAGVAGVIKMVLAMRHGVLPRTLHVDAPSGEVDWSVGGVSLLTEEVPWEANGERLRRAGVSSFGISGTNAHVILEEAPLADPVVHEVGVAILGDAAIPWVVSGRGVEGLRGQAGRLREFVAQDLGLEPADVGSSLLGRPAFEHRAVVVGSDRDELLGGLDALVGDRSAAGVVRGVVRGAMGGVVGAAAGAVRSDGGVGEGAGSGGGVAFVFPGQGGQWPGMAVALLDSSPVFARRLKVCAEALKSFVDWSLKDVLRGEAGAPGLDRVDVVQPALFAVMLSLAALWRACGVQPSVVVGHSQGEIAAACEAGGLSLEDAARVVALRSRALGALAGRGGMVSLAAGAAEAEEVLGSLGGAVELAAVNGPNSVVLSGERPALAQLLCVCEARGLRAREIPVDYAAHSPAVELIRDELLEGCAGIEPRSGEVPFFSSVTGGLLDTAELDGEYWYRNLRETVRFEQAVRAVLADGRRMFVEVESPPSAGCQRAGNGQGGPGRGRASCRPRLAAPP